MQVGNSQTQNSIRIGAIDPIIYIRCLQTPCKGHLFFSFLFVSFQYMTGLLHEGIFHVQGLIQPAICESSPWAYVMCNWDQILICQRHWPSQKTGQRRPFMVLGRIYGHSILGHKFCQKYSYLQCVSRVLPSGCKVITGCLNGLNGAIRW